VEDVVLGDWAVVDTEILRKLAKGREMELQEMFIEANLEVVLRAILPCGTADMFGRLFGAAQEDLDMVIKFQIVENGEWVRIRTKFAETFDEFCAKLRSQCPNLPADFTISYDDDEGDRVTCCNSGNV
jgi:hypothetical protein